jgi:hypothetical protein
LNGILLATAVDNGKITIKAVYGIENIEYENINIDYDIDLLDLWCQYKKKFLLLSQEAKRIFCVQ